MAPLVFRVLDQRADIFTFKMGDAEDYLCIANYGNETDCIYIIFVLSLCVFTVHILIANWHFC